jgi:hypothetical protein
MSKAKQAHINSPGEHAPTEIPLTLRTGNWKELFNAYECNMIRARSLNYCVYTQGLVITGYLIGPNELYLVLEIERHKVHALLMIFFEKLKREIRKHLGALHKKGITVSEYLERMDSDESYDSLYSTVFDMDYQLVRLLTGRKAELPYYNAQTARWKYIIDRSEFCSAADYLGATGPVHLSKFRSVDE